MAGVGRVRGGWLVACLRRAWVVLGAWRRGFPLRRGRSALRPLGPRRRAGRSGRASDRRAGVRRRGGGFGDGSSVGTLHSPRGVTRPRLLGRSGVGAGDPGLPGARGRRLRTHRPYRRPFGWPPGSFSDAVPWPVVNQFVCIAGGLLWAATAVGYGRRSRSACANCGRTDAANDWTSPAAAARWGGPSWSPSSFPSSTP